MQALAGGLGQPLFHLGEGGAGHVGIVRLAVRGNIAPNGGGQVAAGHDFFQHVPSALLPGLVRSGLGGPLRIIEAKGGGRGHVRLMSLRDTALWTTTILLSGMP